MIRIHNLSVSYGRVCALQGFSADLAPGTITALVGGDGAGKTALLRRLSVPAHQKANSLTGITARRIGYQPARSGVWMNLSVAENMAFAARVYGLKPAERQERIGVLLRAAGLDAARDRVGAKLSGGMRQKLGVLMAMVHRPALLLLDEPTTGVDQASRQEIWRLIRQAAQEGATVVLATTYVDEAEQADQIVVLDRGRTVAQGSPGEIIRQMPGQICARQVAATQGVDLNDLHTWQRGRTAFHWEQGPPPAAVAHHTCPEGMTPVTPDVELATVATMLAHRREGEVEMDWASLPLPTFPLGDVLIEGTGISHRFGQVQALTDVGLSLGAGEILGLVGENGAGKSTLIRILLGLTIPTAGRIFLFGHAPNHEARTAIGYVPQSLGLYATLKPVENLAFTLRTFHQPITKTLIDLAQSTGSGLTGNLPLGAQRNLAVVCAMSHQPRLLILDEPTSGMDVLARAQLWKLLRCAASRGMGILISTHYQHEAMQCDRLIRLHQGQVVAA